MNVILDAIYREPRNNKKFESTSSAAIASGVSMSGWISGGNDRSPSSSLTLK